MRAALLAAVLGAAPAAAPADEDAARELYFRGAGAEVRLAKGTRPLPAAAFACVNCHGGDTLGGREGATAIPAIGWGRLSRPAAGRPAYDAAALRRAVTEGVAPGGRPLGAAMPRYVLAPDAAEGLAGFLGTLEAEAQAGIGAAEMAFAPPATALGRAGFEAALAHFNARGMAHGRRLVVTEDRARAVHDFAEAEALHAAIAGAEIEALARAAAADGHRAVAPLGLADGLTPPTLILDPNARAVLLAGPAAADLRGRPVYARRDALTPAAVAAIAEGGGTLTVSDPFPGAAAWARTNGLGREAADGYALGLIAIEAAVAAGRLTSGPRLEALMLEEAGREVAVRRLDPR